MTITTKDAGVVIRKVKKLHITIGMGMETPISLSKNLDLHCLLRFLKIPRTTMSRSVRAAIAVMVIAVPFSAWAADGSNYTVAQKLAINDEGHWLPPGSPAFKRSAAALTAAAKVCRGMTEERLADVSVQASNMLNQDGIPSRPLDVLEGLAVIADNGTDAKTCTYLLGAYVTVRHKQTHSAAVVGLQVLFKAGLFPDALKKP